MKITDKMMSEAAAEMNDAMLRSLPDPNDCHHEFSARFERKMKRVIRKVEHPVLTKVLQRVACVALVLIIGFASVLALSPTVRATVFGWIRERYESFISYYFEDGISANEAAPQYTIGSIPDGYVEIAVSNIPDNQTYIYSNADGQVLSFAYSTNADAINYLVKQEGYVVEETTVHDCRADFFRSKNASKSNCIVWYDDEAKTIFYISGYFEMDNLIKLAESVESKK